MEKSIVPDEVRMKNLDQETKGPILPRRIGNYEFGKTLGKGTFGKVKEAIHLSTGEKVAVKIIEKSSI